MAGLNQVLGKCFPNLAILSLIGNPFHKMLHAPVQVSPSSISYSFFIRATLSNTMIMKIFMFGSHLK